MSSRAKLFVYLNAFFGLSAYLASVRSDYHELQTKKKKKEKLVSLSAHYYKMFCLHFSNMVAQKMTSRTQASGKKKTRISTGREEAEKFQLFPD